MARLTDIIEAFIKDLVDESNTKELEIQRNELANQFSCAPSQINYVLTTRFTIEKGYYIESRRGGGGCIKIKRISCNLTEVIKESLIEKIGEGITCSAGNQIIESLLDMGVITDREGDILKIATNDRTLAIAGEYRNKIRGDILKSIILSLNI